MPDRDAGIREELGRVLASDAFVASPMLASFLRFVVEETLAGREDRLKAYTIAVGALDRPESFDPNDNPVVRVQARRLRQALQRHYETEGADSALRIDLPLGNYVPLFVDTGLRNPPPPVAIPERPPAEPPPSAPEVAPPPPPVAHRPVIVTALAGLLGIGIGVGGWNLWKASERVSKAVVAEAEGPSSLVGVALERKGYDASRVLPLLRVDVDLRGTIPGLDAEIYRNRIESFANRFDDTVVLTRRSPDYPTQAGQPLYVLNVLLARDGNSTNAYYRLIHAGDERILNSGALSLTLSGTAGGRPVAGLQTPEDLSLVRDFIQLHGSISRDLANLPDVSPELSCLAQAWNYYQDSTAENHLLARTCLETVAADNPRLAPAVTMLGAMYLSEYRQKFNPTTDDPLARAEKHLRAATRIAPASSAPYQSLQNYLLIKGDVGAAVQAGARSVDLNPEDMNAVGGYGALLCRVGRYEEALALMQRALANLSSPPKWLQYYTFLALNNLGRTDEADRRVVFLEATRSTLYLTAVAIRAHRRGDEAAALSALAEITRAEPDIHTDPRAFLRRRGLLDPVIDRLTVDLVAAGFDPSGT